MKRQEINKIKKEIGAKKKKDRTDPCTEELERKANIEKEIE